MKLYHYWRSSSSWRVRWGFELKKAPVELVHVSLLDGESESEAHRARNPLGYVPVLELPAGSRVKHLGESMAILEWLDETVATGQPLLPKDPLERARTRQLAEIINAGTQPIQNLSVSLVHAPGDEAAQKKWNAHWTANGLEAYERLVRETAGRFSMGDRITLADLMLIPQCYNAGRQDVDLARFPTVQRIWNAARETAECQASAPERYQPSG